MNYFLFLIPVGGALIGWCSYYVLTRALYRLIPKNKDLIAKKLAQYSKTFFKPDELLGKLGDPANLEKIRPLIDENLDHFLRVKLAKEMPFITAFIGEKTITQLKGLFMTELEQLFPQIMNSYAGSLTKEFDIEKILLTKLSGIKNETIEATFRSSAKQQLRRAGLLATLTGFIIGILVAVVIFLLVENFYIAG